MPRKSTKKPAKTEEIAQPEPETPATEPVAQATEKKSEVRINIKLTSELYQMYQREAQEHAMPAASLMAYALKEWANANFADAVPNLNATQAAQIDQILKVMFPNQK